MPPGRRTIQHPGPTAREHGLTLVEVLVGFVLVGILMVGMNALWVLVSAQIDDSILRQQAVFRINAEMERLSAAYRQHAASAPLADTALVTDYGTAPPLTAGYATRSYIAGASRRIHTGALTTVATTFATPLNDDGQNDGQDIHEVHNRILLFDNGTAADTSDDRNFVWLDRNRGLVGQISWSEMDLLDAPGGGVRPCGGAALPCRFITFYLDYPFRYVDGAQPRAAAGPVETITLQTIVGYRP